MQRDAPTDMTVLSSVLSVYRLSGNEGRIVPLLRAAVAAKPGACVRAPHHLLFS